MLTMSQSYVNEMSMEDMHALTFQKEYVATWMFLSSYLVLSTVFLIWLETRFWNKVNYFITSTQKGEEKKVTTIRETYS